MPYPVSAARGKVSANSIVPITYTLRDEFTTNASAPLTSPRICEPGPGTLTLNQVDGQFSTSGDKLVFPAQTTAAWGDLRAIGGAVSRAAGLALISLMRFTTISNFGIGFSNTATPGSPTSDFDFGFDVGNGSLESRCQGFNPVIHAGLTTATDYRFAIVLRSAGAYLLAKGGVFTDWQLLYVLATNGGATIYPTLTNFSSVGNTDSLRVAILSAYAADDYLLRSNRNNTPTSGTSLTHTADGSAEFTWTVATGETMEFDVRRTDADNRWIVRCSQGGSTIKLIERNAGVETERASAAQTWTNGTKYRIFVSMFGNIIRTYAAAATLAPSSKNTYTSATFNNTATTAMVSGFTTGENFVTWVRTLTGDALTQLNSINP